MTALDVSLCFLQECAPPGRTIGLAEVIVRDLSCKEGQLRFDIAKTDDNVDQLDQPPIPNFDGV